MVLLLHLYEYTERNVAQPPALALALALAFALPKCKVLR